MSDKDGSMDFVAGLLVGVLVGAAAALILAPQSGEDTRTFLRDKGLELRDQAGTLSEEARKRAEALQAQAKEKVGTVQAQVKEKAGDIQAQVKRAVEEGKTAAAKTKEDLLAKTAPQQATEEAPAE